MDEKFSEKTAAFLAALRALCIEHSVQLSVSDYDGMQVWDLTEGEDPIWANGIEDRTVPNA
jgi:hypothetical protein